MDGKKKHIKNKIIKMIVFFNIKNEKKIKKTLLKTKS